MRSLVKRAKENRTLVLQLMFTILAFVFMAVLSYIFMSRSVRENLVRHANSVLDLTEARIDATLLEFESVIGGVAEETQNMLRAGASVEDIQYYIDEISRFTFLDGKSKSGIQDFFGYFETLTDSPILIHSPYWDVPEDYIPEEQDWYRLGVEANGEFAATTPFVNEAGERRFTYTKSIFDENGNSLGVIGLEVMIDLLGESVVTTSLNQGGYGMLLNQEGIGLFHRNQPFAGMSMRDPLFPINVIADKIVANTAIEAPMYAYSGEKSIAFFRTLRYGWYLGLVTPESQYYESMTYMGSILGLLAAVLAAVLVGILIRLDAAKTKSDMESRQKSTFLANMSHEIRTPINAIVGMTAIGKTAKVAERKDYCFTKIDDASRHLLGVINDILDISKIEANKIEMSPTDFSFEKMLQQVVNVINFRVDDKHQQLRVHIDSSIPKALYADDQRLSQVITNLLSNAVKFTPDSGIINLKTQLLDEKDGVYTIQISVSDNGIGISEEQQSRLFQPFEQAETLTTRRYGGTGLGLSLSKSIVELMGGRIWIESELGKGSTFSFTVKVKRGDETKCVFSDASINWENIRILTVDDDQDIRTYFQEIVSGFGANCEVAADGAEALRYIDENKSYNIYFVDLKMPGIDGIELTREIKARKTDNSIVIMISSADLSSVEDEAKKAGVDRFLLKPIFPSAIADAISECIGVVNEKAKETPLSIEGIFEGQCIMFAEDMEINREIVVALLESTKVEIDCAENGVQAVNMYIRNPNKYGLILMDIQMPEMDGYEATRQIRALDIPGAKDVPIIAMTANVFKDDIEKCFLAGMDNHVGKPLDFDKVISLMHRYLKV